MGTPASEVAQGVEGWSRRLAGEVVVCVRHRPLRSDNNAEADGRVGPFSQQRPEVPMRYSGCRAGMAEDLDALRGPVPCGP